MTEKNTITRAAALSAAIDALEGTEFAPVLVKMYEQVTKPRKKSDAPPKTQIENAAILARAVEAMTNHGEPVGSQWLTEHVAGILSTQKATAIMKKGIADGLVTANREGKKVTYSVA